MNDTTKLILIYMGVLGFITFIMYGIDKAKAKAHKWRIPERVLLGMCMIGGIVGGWLGMYVFRHKTKHLKFHVVQILASILWGICIVIAITKL